MVPRHLVNPLSSQLIHHKLATVSSKGNENSHFQSLNEESGTRFWKESACQCRRCRLDPLVRKIPWRRKWKSNSTFLPGKSHEQRSLVGYSPWSCKRVMQDLATKQQQYQGTFLLLLSLQPRIQKFEHFFLNDEQKTRLFNKKVDCMEHSRSAIQIHSPFFSTVPCPPEG